MLACEIVTLAVAAETVTDCVPLLPMVTVPKFKAVEFAVRVPEAVAPDPLRPTLIDEVDPLLVNASVAGSEPDVEGVNFIWNVRLWPAAMVAGSVSPLMP